MKKFLPLFISLFLINALFGQSNLWTPLSQDMLTQQEGEKMLQPDNFTAYVLDIQEVKNRLQSCPEESAPHGVLLDIPMPDGRMLTFELFDSPVMQSGLAAKYPYIRTFSGYAIDNPTLQGRFDYTPEGFHGYILGLPSAVIIDPVFRQNDHTYQSFFRKELKDGPESEAFICDVATENQGNDLSADQTTHTNDNTLLVSPRTTEVQMRTYRLVVATTGEYSSIYGNTKPTVLAEVVKAINRINSIIGRDFAITFELVNNTDTMFYFNAESDPYTNGNTGLMINQNPTAINSKFALNDYDMGHVFGTQGGGLAQLQSICTGNKARGVTSAGGNVADGFYVDYVAHEMGHQLGSNHTFNNCSGFAGGNENPGTAYEPGSGSTIMSYSGICGSNNILFDSYPYYHVSSLQEITNYMLLGNGSNCAEKTNTDNHYPTSDVGREDDFYIPINTAFKLEGSATDEDSDELTYSWEQYDLGPLSDLGSPEGNAPLFEYLPPTEKTYRFFPRLGTIFSGSQSNKEVLPSISRDMTFQFVVRDNHPGGGAAAWDKLAFKATDLAGPFMVTLPGFSDNEWLVGEYTPVEWDVANTDKAPVNCKKVNIRLIKGQDYDNSVLLAQNVTNNGKAYVQVPDQVNSGYHIIVEAADNVFLDASNAAHTIISPTAPSFSAGISNTGLQVCVPTTEQITIHTAGIGGYSGNITLSYTGTLPAGANVTFESTEIAVGESTSLILDFENTLTYGPIDIQIVATGANADPISMNLHLEVVDFNFTALTTTYPSNGEANVAIFPELSWPLLGGNVMYDIQLASSPSFDSESILAEKINTSDLTFAILDELEVNSVYYWRVRAHNACGNGPWTIPAAFSTVSVNCNVTATETPLIISANNTGTTTSTITVPASGTVSDLNVSHMKGKHSFLGEITIKLIAPSGETAILIDKKCNNYSANFDLSFDDEAAELNPCIGTGKTKPEEPFSVFQGISTQGDWTLSVTDDTPGSGGKINTWAVELCSDAVINAPTLIKNETLTLDGGTNKAIKDDLLLAEDADNTSTELIFTLVQAPLHGLVKKDWTVMEPGTQITQEEINEGKLRYFNYGEGFDTDYFYFTVSDGNGGLIPVTKYNVAINPLGDKAIDELSLSVFPNPVKDVAHITFSERMTGSIQIRIVDITGRIVKEMKRNNTSQVQFSTDGIASGSYLVQVNHNGQLILGKLVVLR